MQARSDGDWADIWKATGAAELRGGEAIRASDLTLLYDEVSAAGEPEVAVGEEVVVILYGSDGNLTSSFVLTDAATDGEWISPANRSSSACD